MQDFRFTATSECDTDRLGKALAQHLPETATLALEGTLGSGKTRLVQAIAAASGVDPQSVTSPTFVLCHHYCGQRPIYHLDAYRIHDPDEFLELGVEEYFAGPGWTIIEWADRVAACLPDQQLRVSIEVTGATQRQFDLVAYGEECERALERIAGSTSADR
jgi:tRNA threonylcarbamoyladenosine biosynthesis protein TsaE